MALWVAPQSPSTSKTAPGSAISGMSGGPGQGRVQVGGTGTGQAPGRGRERGRAVGSVQGPAGAGRESGAAVPCRAMRRSSCLWGAPSFACPLGCSGGVVPAFPLTAPEQPGSRGPSSWLAGACPGSLRPVQSGSVWAGQAGGSLGLGTRAPSDCLAAARAPSAGGRQLKRLQRRGGAGLLLPFSEAVRLGPVLPPSPGVLVAGVALHVVQEIGC